MAAAEEQVDREEPGRSGGPDTRDWALVVLGVALLVAVVAALYLWGLNRTLSSQVEGALSASAAEVGDRMAEAELLLDDALRGFRPGETLMSAVEETLESARVLERIATVPLDPEYDDAWLLMNRALLASTNVLNEAHWSVTRNGGLTDGDRGALIELRSLVGAIADAIARTAKTDGGTVVFDPSFVGAAVLMAEDYVDRY